MNVRVLLVDDHRDARTALAQRLRRHPELMLVGVASGLEEAVQLLPQARPSIVLLDIHGQGGGSVDGCRILRGLTDAPVVILTSFMTDDLWAAAREAGAADYLLKHIDTERLSRKIIRLAEQHRAGHHREELPNDTEE